MLTGACPGRAGSPCRATASAKADCLPSPAQLNAQLKRSVIFGSLREITKVFVCCRAGLAVLCVRARAGGLRKGEVGVCVALARPGWDSLGAMWQLTVGMQGQSSDLSFCKACGGVKATCRGQSIHESLTSRVLGCFWLVQMHLESPP